MSDSPFQIRQIDQDEIITTKVEIPAYDLIRHTENKNVGFLLRSRGYRDQIIIPADLLLNIDQAPPKEPPPEPAKLLLPMAFIAGIAIGILIFGPFLMGAGFAWAITALLALFIGMMLGWESRKKSQDRWQAFFDQSEYYLNRLKNKVLKD